MPMNITLTQEAFAQWAAICRRSDSHAKLQRELQKQADRGDLFFTKLQGRPVVFMDHGYWTYAAAEDGRSLTLLACVARLQSVG